MPLTKKGKTIKKAMTKTYGKEKGTQVFYASQNKGTIKGTHKTKVKTKAEKAAERKTKATKLRKVLSGVAKKRSTPKAKAKPSKNPYTITPGNVQGKNFRSLAKSMRGVTASRRAAAKKSAKVKKR